MRSLELNKTSLWYVEPIGYEDEIEGGLYTGEQKVLYSLPKRVRVSMYPTTGNVSRQIHGRYVRDTYVGASSTSMSENALLFKSLPMSDYFDNFDYIVTGITESINTTNYTLGVKV